ncbi:protein mono-ADP-ribosyltransferase PARP4 isoform X1 [Penaeus vannamei]|uniref:protein mono-ADP-ribosyltransferase PARP4 isoform X1 n=1 Tax=Penaeus vannamei TaxID=6689 RepID=UPI00387F716D
MAILYHSIELSRSIRDRCFALWRKVTKVMHPGRRGPTTKAIKQLLGGTPLDSEEGTIARAISRLLAFDPLWSTIADSIQGVIARLFDKVTIGNELFMDAILVLLNCSPRSVHGKPIVREGTVPPRIPIVREGTVPPRIPIVGERSVPSRTPIVGEGSVPPRTPIVGEGSVPPRTPIVGEGSVPPRTPIVGEGRVPPRSVHGKPIVGKGSVPTRSVHGKPICERHKGRVPPRSVHGKPIVGEGRVPPRSVHGKPICERHKGRVPPRSVHGKPIVGEGRVPPRTPIVGKPIPPRIPIVGKGTVPPSSVHGKPIVGEALGDINCAIRNILNMTDDLEWYEVDRDLRSAVRKVLCYDPDADEVTSTLQQASRRSRMTWWKFTTRSECCLGAAARAGGFRRSFHSP